MSLVLDSSATLAWIYGDETTDSIREQFDQVIDEGAIVPALWRLEVANSLTVAVRRSRIDVEFRRAALADLARAKHGFVDCIGIAGLFSMAKGRLLFRTESSRSCFCKLPDQRQHGGIHCRRCHGPPLPAVREA